MRPQGYTVAVFIFNNNNNDKGAKPAEDSLDREKDIMDKLQKLSHAWEWAKLNTSIPHDAIDQHITNMRHALNRGLTIVPLINSDTLGTLTDMDKNDNLSLFDFGRAMARRNKDFSVVSTSFKMARDFCERNRRHGDDFVPYQNKDDMHNGVNLRGGEILEMLIDDMAKDTSNRRFYVSTVLPTWDKTLIRFP